jgi:uncharacterized DUF497 family protein
MGFMILLSSWICLGLESYTERRSLIRIISAREVTRAERDTYEEG